jgi:endo-1,3(4)-beta-glucanase
VASSYDPLWGKKYFENILFYIRDIANPSRSDKFFPTFRHKDWFLGSSWASGIATIGNRPYPNGRNQESSSEAIAAYEAIGLYGEMMVKVYGGDKALGLDYPNAVTASRIRDLGRLLTATELRSAKSYWHSMKSDTPGRLYPPAYTPPAVGMLWSTMAQFQTWFGNAPYLPIGIQLIPITPVAGIFNNLFGHFFLVY